MSWSGLSPIVFYSGSITSLSVYSMIIGEVGAFNTHPDCKFISLSPTIEMLYDGRLRVLVSWTPLLLGFRLGSIGSWGRRGGFPGGTLEGNQSCYCGIDWGNCPVGEDPRQF